MQQIREKRREREKMKSVKLTQPWLKFVALKKKVSQRSDRTLA